MRGEHTSIADKKGLFSKWKIELHVPSRRMDVNAEGWENKGATFEPWDSWESLHSIESGISTMCTGNICASKYLRNLTEVITKLLKLCGQKALAIYDYSIPQIRGLGLCVAFSTHQRDLSSGRAS